MYGQERSDDLDLQQRAHRYSDVDKDRGAQHHTLGNGPNQAAPGKQTDDRLLAVEELINQLIPIGSTLAYPSVAAPNAKWLLCDGSSFDGATYPDLAALLGGTTLPNYKGKVLVGRDASQAEFDTLGEVGGAKTHTLTVAEMPSHTHDIGNQTMTASVGAGGGSAVDNGGGSLVQGTTTGRFNHLQTIVNGETIENGDSLPHNNLQPYAVTNYWIRAL